MEKPADERSATAIAFEWAATAMTISAEMVVPGLLGYWLDQRLGTRVLFLFVGFALGGTLATLGLMRIAKNRGGNAHFGPSESKTSDGQAGAGDHDKRSTPDAER